ncbi:MAG: hypothetical protein ACM31C_16025 [Acidobacteriota bacterium]
MRSLPIALVLAGCVASSSTSEPTAPNQLSSEGKADDGAPLWAGLTSVTLERYAPDPCDDGAHALGDDPIVYDEWVRERAGIRNVCFEVWSPGVTDTDNPDYWKLLDVEAHYRFGDGPWQMQYVPSIDRRGNNRRYAWSIDYSLDPMANAASVVAVGAPLTILSESSGWAMVQKDLQLYFTVNGHELKSGSGLAFTVRYQGGAREPSLAASASGYVLYPDVTCAGGAFVMGSGAGFFAVDIRDPGAAATLGAGLDGSLIYGTPVTASAGLFSGTFSSETTDPGQTLPSYRDPGGTRIYPDGSTMHVEVDVYDRATNAVRTLTASFAGCAATASH